MVRDASERWECGSSSSEGAAVESHLCFRRTVDVGFVLSSLFFFVSFGHDCAVCPSSGLTVVLVGCYIYIAGRKPVSRGGGRRQAGGSLVRLVGHLPVRFGPWVSLCQEGISSATII